MAKVPLGKLARAMRLVSSGMGSSGWACSDILILLQLFMKHFLMTFFLYSTLFSFPCPLVRTNFPSRFLQTSIYDITALRRTLADLIDLNRLNRSEIHLVVSSVDIETGEVTYFENQNGVPLSIEHIVASGGLAPGFPMTTIKDQGTGEE